MAEENIVLENVQVDRQGGLTGKIKQGGEETTPFTELFQRIQNHFSDEQMVSIIPQNIRQNDLCVGKSSQDHKWHRVRVDSVLSTGHGFQASCFFVDRGTFEMIPLPFLRHIPETFLQVPFQLKKLRLYGITPITLSISPEDLMTSMKPCYRWDSAAVDFIKKNIELSHKFTAVVMEEKDSYVGIRLYLTLGRTQFCLNDRLVKERYAMFAADADDDTMEQPTVEAKPKRTIAEVLKSKKITLKEPAFSESEDQNYVSEPDLKFGLNQSSGGSEHEQGYTTDPHVIFHRHKHARLSRSPQKFHSETMTENKRFSESVDKKYFHDRFSDTQESDSLLHRSKEARPKKTIFDKLAASHNSVSSGQSPLLSDVQSQKSYPVREKQHSLSSSQSSLSRLQISSTTVTSYRQSGSESDNSDFSHGAQSNISKFQTVSQISPHNTDNTGFSHAHTIKTKPQTGSQISPHDTEYNYGAQSSKSKFQTVSHKSPQTVPQLSSTTASKASSIDFSKGYQSDTSHVHSKKDSAVNPCSSPHMCSDTENDRLMSYTNLVKSQLIRQKMPFALQQCNSPQGLVSDSSDSKSYSPLESLLKEFSASNSSLSDSGRGRGILLPVRGRGIASPSMSQGSLVASQGDGSPVRGRGRGTLSPAGRGTTLAYSPTLSESPFPSKQYSVQFDTGVADKVISDSENLKSDKGSMSGHAVKPGKKSVFDKITDACAQSPVPYSSDADKSSASVFQEGLEREPDSVRNLRKSASTVSDSSHVYFRDSQTEILSGKKRYIQNLKEDTETFLSDDNESVLMARKLDRKQKQNLYTSEMEIDNFQYEKQSKTGKVKSAAIYSSGTETDTTSLLAKSVMGQQVYSKARLPREATQRSPERSSHTKPLERSLPLERRPPASLTPQLDTDSELDQSKIRLRICQAGDAPERLSDPKQKMMQKQTGQRLLKGLKDALGTQKSSSREKQEKGMFGVDDNVLVHGIHPKKPIYKFSDAIFEDIVSQYWIHRDFPSLKIVQAYSWPAIRGGRHVVAIAPPGTGKTLAYLCPLITSLTDQRLYKDVGSGNGPYLLILTSSWRKADAVFLEMLNMIGNRNDLKIVLIHGGGQEENKGCQLINGCEILVVTPPSLKRVMDAGYTDLLRLCHLVIDDAEEIMENFGEEIKFIMREYTGVISNQRLHCEVPRQLLLFGTQWTGRIHSFMNIYPVEPLLIITSAFEASIYGKVKQITHMCREDGRAREITGILDNLSDENRTIIFASKKHDILNLFKIVRNYSRFCLMVHQDTEMWDISHVAEEWRHHNVNLLVCCDAHISEMKIFDARTIINYDLPSSKTQFCNRLACLRKYFWNFSAAEESTVEPVSHLMITENVQSAQAVAILQLLKRSNSPVPQELKALMAGAKRGKEEDEEKELCSQLLGYGFCRNQWKCPFRHVVFPELDHTEESNWLPDEGEVEVFVTHVINASHYYVRLISVRHGDIQEELGTTYSKLQMDMGLWYSNLSNLTRHKSPYEGEICGFQDRENFYRVQILHFKDMNCRGAVNIDVTVKFVDSGRVDDIPAHKLYELPEHLKKVPFQAVEVFVCRIKPIDRDTEWTDKADRFIYSLLHDKVVKGKIVLRLGSILWLDPLVERQSLGETRTIINKAYVHRELITNGFADENPNHLEKLYKLCEDKVKIPKALIKKAKLDFKLETDVLPECKQYHKVVVSSVANPGLFFIQRNEKLDELDELMQTVKTLMTSQDPVEDVGVEVQVGDYCLAEYTSYDKRWYRGRITKLEDDLCEVFFADYGDRDSVPRDKVRKIPNDDKLIDFPLQAIECSLADIEPKGSQWEETTGDVLWDLSHFVNSDMKTFTAKVKSKGSPEFSGHVRYVVELYDTSGPQDFNLAQELVHQRMAQLKEDSDLTNLFDKPSRLKRLLQQQGIPDLCASLYWEEAEAAAIKIAGEIQTKFAEVLSSSSKQVEKHVLKSAIASIVKLVGRVEFTDVNRLVLHTVLVIAKAGERFSQELLQEDCDQQIIRGLELNSNIEVQTDTADVLARLLEASSSWRSCFEDQKYLEVLWDLFDSTSSQQIQGLVCHCFHSLCASQGVFDYVMKKNMCSSLAKLSQSDDHEVVETVINLLLKLSQHNSHPHLERESLIQAVIVSLKKTNCEQCIQLCVKFCSKFGSLKRKNKTVLLELEMVPCLSRILQGDLTRETRVLCKDLIDSLAIKVPTQKMSGVHARSSDEPPKQNVVAPEILWAQNSFNVILRVKVKDAADSSDLVKIQEDMISFRAIVDGVCFSFHYKLFDKVMSDHSRIRVKASEVQISMKKVEKGKWPRLLFQKQKPANLCIDFERFVDSSDSEFSEDEPFLLKRKKTRKPVKDTPKTKAYTAEHYSDSETDTTDSLENMDDPDRDNYNVLELNT